MAVGYKFPVVDFSGLAELPKIADEANTRNARKQALAGLDSSSSSSLENTASALLRAGDLDGATKLFNIVQQRNTLAQKGANDELYNKYILPKIIGGQFGIGGATPAGGAAATPPGSYSPPPVDTGPAPPPAGLKPWPGPQSALPPPPGAPPLAAVGMAPLEPPADSSAAEAPVPDQQVAQAGPPVVPPQTVPPSVPAPGRSPPVPGQPPPGFDPRTTVIPGTLPEPPPKPRPQAPRLAVPGQDQAALEEADKAYKDALLLSSSKGAPSGLAATARQRLSSALDRLKVTPEERDYNVDQVQRAQLGLDPVSRSDWQKGKQGYGPLLEELIKTDADIQKRGNRSTDVLQSLNTLDAIQRNPDFQSGKSQALVNKGVSLAGTLINTAKNLGIQLPEEFNLENMRSMNTAKLGEVFSAVSNRLIFDALGGLGAQVSNSDRSFVSESFPNLALTPQGNRLLTKYLQEQYAQDKAAAAVGRTYRKQYGVNADAPGLIDAVQNYRDEHPIVMDKNSKYLDTPLAKEIQGALNAGERKTVYDATLGPGSSGRTAIESAGEAAKQGTQSFIQDFISKTPGLLTGPSPTGGNLPGVEAVRSEPGGAAAQAPPESRTDYTDVLTKQPQGSSIIRSKGKIYILAPNKKDRIPLVE